MVSPNYQKQYIHTQLKIGVNMINMVIFWENTLGIIVFSLLEYTNEILAHLIELCSRKLEKQNVFCNNRIYF